MTIHNSLSELIGNTPLVKLNHVTDGIKATIAVKVEYLNPGGSSKDRIAERIIDAAERSGELKPGGVIVGTDLRQHRRRTRARGFAARIPCDLHPAGQGFRSQACGAARIRRRSGRDPTDAVRTILAPTTRSPNASPRRFPVPTVPTSTTIRTVRKATTAAPDRKSGRPRTIRSRILWPASAPAAPSPARAAI